jgi:hypothetical protein
VNNNKSIFSITFVVAIGLVFVGTESTISYELATTQKGDVRVGLQENGSDSTALRDYPLVKGYAYRLQVKVEGINQEEVNVTSTADTPSGISVARGFQLIDTHFDTKTIYVYLYGNQVLMSVHSIRAESNLMVPRYVQIP